MSNEIQVNDTLTVGVVSGERPHVYIERRGAGLVRIELDEVRVLVATLADAASRAAADSGDGVRVFDEDLWW